MENKFSLKKSVTIHAPVENVWKALTDAGMIKKYFLGVETRGEWKKGNTIIFQGEWQGKPYHGKGKVLQTEKKHLLKHSFWSDMSGLTDEPANYHIITYEIGSENGNTRLNLTEENLADETMKERSSGLWNIILDNLKKLLEN